MGTLYSFYNHAVEYGAGLSKLILHWGEAGILVAVLLFAAYMLPSLKLKVLALMGAVGVAAFMFGMGVGTIDEGKRKDAQYQVRIEQVDKQVDRAIERSRRIVTPDSVRRDPYNSPSN